MSPILEVQNVTMRFGGIVANRDVSFTGQTRRGHRPDRPQWRRQDDDVQLHHRILSLQ